MCQMKVWVVKTKNKNIRFRINGLKFTYLKVYDKYLISLLFLNKAFLRCLLKNQFFFPKFDIKEVKLMLAFQRMLRNNRCMGVVNFFLFFCVKPFFKIGFSYTFTFTQFSLYIKLVCSLFMFVVFNKYHGKSCL